MATNIPGFYDKTYSGLIQYGSKGDDVSRWQNYLNSQGYDLKIDGIFGNDTLAATMKYQAANGLTADGKVGEQTFGKAGFTLSNNSTMGPATPSSTTISAPTLEPAPEIEPFERQADFIYGNYGDTEEGKSTKKAMDDADAAVKGYGDFTYSRDSDFQNIVDSILNRDKFSYDLNGDALYQQYKDKYIQQGKMAMQDTMGQAAAMTGGYGNSYAQSAGQQAYNAHLENLNDIVPELYQMAYDRYNQEGQDLYNKYSMLSDDRNTEYGMWGDGYNRLVGERDYATNKHFNSANLFNTDRDNHNTLEQNEWTNAFDIWKANNTNALNVWKANNENTWNKATWDRDNQWREEDQAVVDRQLKLAEDELELKKNPVTEYTTSIPAGDGSETYTFDGPPPLEYSDTKAVNMFKASIKTRHEFNSRGGYDKKTYGTYEAYIEGVLDRWLSEGKLNDNEVATLLDYYGLA